MTDETPTYFTPLVGYRAWFFPWRDGVTPKLRSLVMTFYWPPKTSVLATCGRAPTNIEIAKHECPGPEGICRCGVYGFFDLERARTDARPYMLTVKGAILGWGKVEVHERGYRAEKATVCALLREREEDLAAPMAKLNDQRGWPEGLLIDYPKYTRALEALGTHYGVPVLDETDLELYAETWGDRR